MESLFDAPPAFGHAGSSPTRRDEVYAEKKARRQARQQQQKQEHQYHQHQHQQYQPAHLYHDEYARVGADRAANPRSNRGVALPQLGRGDFYRPQVRAPYAVQDLPAAGKKPIDSARRAAVAPRPERWGSPRGERARRIERQQQWPSLADEQRQAAEARAAAQAARAAAQAEKIRVARDRLGFNYEAHANDGVQFSHAHQRFVMGGGGGGGLHLPPISLRGARQEMEAHHARRQREHRAPWE